MSQPLAGEIRMFAGNYAPNGWAFCDGQTLDIGDHRALFGAIGSAFGGDGKTTFALPDMRGRIPVHRGAGIAQGQAGGSELASLQATQLPGHNHTARPVQASGTSYSGAAVTMRADANPVSAVNGTAVDFAAGGDNAHENVQPYLCIHFIIALHGDMEPLSLAEPFIGEVRLYAGTLAPRGWRSCNGQSLRVSEHPELFSVLGTTYGGDGRDRFSLPDLRGRVSMHPGHGTGLTLRKLGESGGAESVALTESHLPHHAHAMETAGHGSAAGNVVFASQPNGGSALASATLVTNRLASGAAQPHNNLQPYLALNYIVATTGNTAD